MNIEMVKFEPMNEVHKNEIKILEKLLNSLETGENIKENFEEFLEDVKNHFAFEENLMNKYNFFAKIPHKMEHDRIINELLYIQNHLDEREKVKQYFEETFIPWLHTHIETMDTVTAGFFDMVKATI